MIHMHMHIHTHTHTHADTYAYLPANTGDLFFDSEDDEGYDYQDLRCIFLSNR